MIRQLENVFVLDTRKTTYCFQVLETGHLEHLYYGKKLRVPKAGHIDALVEKSKERLQTQPCIRMRLFQCIFNRVHIRVLNCNSSVYIAIVFFTKNIS